MQTAPKSPKVSAPKSVVSIATTKSKSGALTKHCFSGNCGGKMQSGTNWSRHA